MTSTQPTARRWRTALALAAILVLGAYFRTIGLTSWDEPSFRLHPDERFMTQTASSLRVPATLGDYFDSSLSTLNPRNQGSPFYVYGMLPQTLTRLTAVMLTNSDELPETVPYPRASDPANAPQVPNPERDLPRLSFLMPLLNPEEANLTDYWQIYKIGRAWSTLFDLGSIVVVFLLGRRLYSRRAGLLAALLYSLAVLPIQLSHFFTVDTATAFFTLLSVYWCVRVAQQGGVISFVALGMSIGAAMACRVTMAALGLLAVVAVLQRLLAHGPARQQTGDSRPETADKIEGQRLKIDDSNASTRYPLSSTITLPPSPLHLLSLAALLALAGVLALFTFRVLQPDAFVGSRPDSKVTGPSLLTALDPIFSGRGFFDLRPEPRFIGNITEIGKYVSGEADSPPSQQWANRVRYLFAWQNITLWGLGLPLGLAAWLAWAAAGWQMVRRQAWMHLLPWFWIAFYFAWQGGIQGMTMRYYLILYGLLALLAAWGLLALADRRLQVADWGRKQLVGSRRWARFWWLPLGVVVLGTLLWAFAFTRIYTEPHSRIQASRWIYDHIPPGAALTFEEWDDALPLSLDGRNSNQYVGVKTFPYLEDDQSKYIGYTDQAGTFNPGMLDQLDQADYVILSSNRVYDSATRMPQRYPAVTRYYHALFSGELGFELVADIHSYPRLFGIEIPTPVYAEEAFSVYDHPRVLIFKKTPAYTRALAERLIAEPVAWGEVYKLPTARASKVPTALRLTQDQWPAYRESGSWAGIFGWNLLGQLAPWLAWLLALELVGIAAFLLLFAALRGLPDRGFALSKTLGLLLVAYLAWLGASLGNRDGVPLVPFTAGSAWAWVGLLALAGGLAGWWQRGALRAFAAHKRTALLTAEGLFLLAFVGFVIIRALNPDLWHPARGGEKPMDLTFLTAVAKSQSFPPYDPWFAGGYINYYYFGFVLVGFLVKLTGIEPAIAYNLAVPTIFALTALGAWGVAYNLLAHIRRQAVGSSPQFTGSRQQAVGGWQQAEESATGDQQPATGDQQLATSNRRLAGEWRHERAAIAAGLLAVLFVTLLGNLANAAWLLPGSAKADETLSAACASANSYAAQQTCRGRLEGAFWDATRITGMALRDSTINEFPYFTFLFGDLHAHMIALPLMLAALGLMVALVRAGARARHEPAARGGMRGWVGDMGGWVQLAVVVPMLGLVIGALRATNTWDYPTALGLAILAAGLVAWANLRRGAGWQQALAGWALATALLVGVSSVLFLPFTSTFATDYAGFELWKGERTPLTEFLMINGLWLFLSVSAALLYLRRRANPTRLAIAISAGVLIVAGVMALLQPFAGRSVATPVVVLLVLLVGATLGLLVEGLGVGGQGSANTRQQAVDQSQETGDTRQEQGGVRLIAQATEAQVHTRSLSSGQFVSASTQNPLPGALTLLLFMWGLAALGLCLLTEVFVAKGDIGRMNTVFKFGMQSWVLFGVVTAVGLVRLWQWTGATGSRRQAADGGRQTVDGQQAAGDDDGAAGGKQWTEDSEPTTNQRSHPSSVDRLPSALGSSRWSIGGLLLRAASLLLIAAALVYPLTATPARLGDRFDTKIAPTLDGLAFMRAGSWAENDRRFTFDEDATALAWLRQNVAGTPIVLEAQTEGYRWGGRVAIYTGLPTLLGWPWHETQQRSVAQVQPVLESRKALIRQLYSGGDPAATIKLLRLYGVEYVYIGKLERALYDPAGLATFDNLATQGLLTRVYQAGETQIYQVPAGENPPGVLTTSLPIRPPDLPASNDLLLREPVGNLPAVDEYGWNRLANSQPVAVLLWLLAWYALAALGLPLAVAVFGHWRDAGYSWARLIGLLLLSYCVWMPVSLRLWHYNLSGLWLGVAIMVLLNALVVVWTGTKTVDEGRRTEDEGRRTQDDQSSHLPSTVYRLPSTLTAGLRHIWRQLYARRRAVLATELLFLGGFALMLLVRAFNPDLWQPIWGGEKPFEFGLLNAVLRSPVMPPYSPFYSDGIVNYYYYGFFLVSLPVKATGIAPAVGFNLIVPTLFGLLLAGSFALATQLTRRMRYGLAGAAFVAIFGNFATVFQSAGSWSRGLGPVLQGLQNQGLAGLGEPLGDWFVGPSRVIPYTINEFPFWSFLFADLHPHLIALPISVLAIALAYTLFDSRRSGWLGRRLALALAALTLGALAITNSWDFPTYGLLCGGALLGAAWRAPISGVFAARRTPLRRRRLLRLGGALLTGIALGAVALLLYLPFFQGFVAQVRGLGLVQAGTAVQYYLLIYGLFLAILLPAIFGAARRLLRTRSEPQPLGLVAGNLMRLRSPLRNGLLIIPLLLVVLALVQPALGLKLWLGALLLASAALLLLRRLAPATWFSLWLALVAWAVSLGFETVYIRDHLAGGDYYRMNTVFKFGLQVWVLLALAAAAALPRLLAALRRSGAVAYGAGSTVLLALGALALLYPLIATPNRVSYRFPNAPGPTLDGLAFLEQASYTYQPSGQPGAQIDLRADGEAIRWLNSQIKGTPVVLQSSLSFYREYGVRVAANTGLPTVSSWIHEAEQRDPDAVSAREDDIRSIYLSPDINDTLRLLSKYRVNYVYFGPIERAAYGTSSETKFEQLVGSYVNLAYRNDAVQIYQVNEAVFSLPPLLPVVAREEATGPGRQVTPEIDPAVAEAPPPVTRPEPAPVVPAESQAELERQVAENPTAPGPAFALAEIYRSQKLYDLAADVLAPVAAANPDDVGLHHLWGDNLRDAGRPDEAEAAYRQAALAKPNSGNWNKLGMELLKVGKLGPAEEALRQAIAADASASDPYFYLGMVYEQQSQRERAIQSYEQYLALTPAGPHQAAAQEALQRLR